jgi:hypothetical protein
MTTYFSTDFRNILKYQILWKSVPGGGKSFRTDRQTNRQKDMTKLIAAFRNFGNTPTDAQETQKHNAFHNYLLFKANRSHRWNSDQSDVTQSARQLHLHQGNCFLSREKGVFRTTKERNNEEEYPSLSPRSLSACTTVPKGIRTQPQRGTISKQIAL